MQPAFTQLVQTTTSASAAIKLLVTYLTNKKIEYFVE
jgi:hypothetical protein